MKVRQGFISNSSSSSFVMIGMKVKDSDSTKMAEALMEFYPIKEVLSHAKEKEECEHGWEWEDYCYDYLEEAPGGFTYFSEGEYFGKLIVDSGMDDYMDDFSIPVEELSTMIYETKKIANAIGLNEKEVKLMGGTRAC